MKWITIGLLTLSTYSFCQTHIVRYSDLLKEIYESQKDSIFYENVTFKDDIGIDEKSLLQYLNGLKTTKDTKGYFLVNKKIFISGCVFESDFYLFKTSFSESVYFNENKFPNKAPDTHRLDNSAYLILDSCLFNKELLIVSLNKSVPIFKVKVTSCKINHAFWYLEMSSVEISKSDFTERFKLNLENNSSIKIDSTSLLLDSKYDSKIGNYQGEFTELVSCSIKGNEDLVFEIASSAKETVIESNTFNTNVQVAIAQSVLTFSRNTFTQNLGLDLSKIDESIFIDMKSLRDFDFGLYLEKQDFPKIWQYFDGSTHEDIRDEKTFKHYFRTYKILYDYFRLIGDIQSANKAYVKIRELEGRVIQFDYTNNPSFKNFFSLALNRLLKSYTAYGTDPARAILVSFYIILLFGAFYFFFPSDWDVTSKSMLIEKFKDFIEKNDKGYVKPFLRLLLGFAVSFINASTLSLNAFTTLGFGNIPTHGIARYVCIMQGFIGWFLLSIFTVALINQAQF